MSRAVRAVVLFLIVTAAIAAVCAVGGSIFAAFSNRASAAHAIAWAMWIGGALTVLLVGQSGSTTRMAGESRIVVGGRFVQGSDLPQPTSPFFLIPAGVLVIALGALIYAF
jgi:putative copper export protein